MLYYCVNCTLASMLYKTNVVARLVTVQYLLQLRLPLKEQMKEFSQTCWKCNTWHDCNENLFQNMWTWCSSSLVFSRWLTGSYTNLKQNCKAEGTICGFFQNWTPSQPSHPHVSTESLISLPPPPYHWILELLSPFPHLTILYKVSHVEVTYYCWISNTLKKSFINIKL